MMILYISIKCVCSFFGVQKIYQFYGAISEQYYSHLLDLFIKLIAYFEQNIHIRRQYTA